MAKKILMHTTAFLKYVDLYNKYTFPSVAEDIERLKAKGYDIEFNRCAFGLEKLPPVSSSKTGNVTSDIILADLRDAIKRCVIEDMIFFLLPPDTIFGRGTLYNAITMIEDKPEQCLAIPHVRIAKDDYNLKNPSNRELVDMCFLKPHASFVKSFDEEPSNCTWAGISLRRIDETTVAMIHNLPTVYAAQFNAQDIAFWDNQICFGNWDRGWLNILWKTNRVKVIGNSDVCFCVEITDATMNVPPCYPGLKYSDKFFQMTDHNWGFNKFICTLTGTGKGIDQK